MPRVARRAPARPAVPAATRSESFEQYLEDIRHLPMISSVEEERRLARAARAGCPDATERLVTANLRFVISFVKRYQGHGLELSDLVAIGNEGLLRAVHKFDPDRGVKFISYAVWWIRQAVLKALAEQTRTVRFPLNQNTAVIRFSKVQALLTREMGRNPTDDELAQAMGMSLEEVRQSRRMFLSEVSLDAPSDPGEGRSLTLGERIAVPDHDGGQDIESRTDESLRRTFLQRIFKKHLTPREAKILSLYYGLEQGKEALTLEEIGVALGVTRERIRQLRERAFEKLRACPDVQYLGKFHAA